MKLPITNIQRFSTHDGPGIRTTVFLKGCPLSCVWCHNPETISPKQQIFYTAQNCIGCGACTEECPNKAHLLKDGCHVFDVTRCDGCGRCVSVCPTGALEAASKSMSIEEITDIVMRDKAFYGKTGGITLSGGEPLLHPVGCIELLKKAKSEGITTAIETSGFFDRRYIPELVKYTDLFLWDFKDSDYERHKKQIGVYPDEILNNLFILDNYNVKILLSCILVNGINTIQEHYSAIAETYHKLSHCVGVKLLPYHAYGGSKMVQLGYLDNGRKEWVPNNTVLRDAVVNLKSIGVLVKN